ncbi:AraC family transcriptional regulator [Tenacibaculum sp. 190130A14a]|uniref:AraC family transcriptional regulator n=2 Tax=Tenacibaculum polynesiense TaxID=3137857 RepID=A0ABM9P7R5_9FLAO
MFNNPLLFFICSLGVFNGILVSMFFLFFDRTKRVSNFLFGLLVFFLSLRIGKSVYRIFYENHDLLIMQIGLSACFMIGISLFYYLKASVENRKEIPKSWKVHFVILLIFICVVGIVKPYKTSADFWRWFVWVIYGSWGLYLLMSTYVLKPILSKIILRKAKCSTSEFWLIGVLVGNWLIYGAYIIGYYYLYLIGTITFSIVFYGLLFFFLLKSNRESIFKDLPERYSSKKIEEDEVSILKRKLDTLMKEEEVYKKSDVKLSMISKKIGVSSHKLSQFLNDNLGKSFATFLNEYRIEEAKRLLKENDNITLESIGFEAGFSSKSNFYATFKKLVGQTPAQYQKAHFQ